MSDERTGNTAPMLQTSVEQSGAEWVVMVNVDGESREHSRHADEAAAREAERSLRTSAEDGAIASDDHAG